MGFPFLTSKPNLLRSKAKEGWLIKKTIGVGYRSLFHQEHSTTRYLKLCPSSSLFNRYNHVNRIPRGVRFFHEKSNGFVHREERIFRFQKWDFLSSILKFVKNNDVEIATFSTLCMIVLYGVERVPYSNKTHLLFSFDVLEKYIGTHLWNIKKEKYKQLDQDNPEVIRVQKILNVLLGTMHKGLGLEHGYIINGTDLVGEVKKDVGRKVKNRRRSRFGLKYGTKHLEGLDWEVMLLDDHKSGVFYLPHGKIGVNVGAVEGLSDSVLAATIAHEIGHGVARHIGEGVLRGVFWYLPTVLTGDFWHKCSIFLFELFFHRRQVIEADHIGLILMALAGYDPRAALDAYCNDGHKGSVFSTLPSAEKRAKMLEKNMGKAVAIYEQVLSGQEVKNNNRKSFWDGGVSLRIGGGLCDRI